MENNERDESLFIEVSPQGAIPDQQAFLFCNFSNQLYLHFYIHEHISKSPSVISYIEGNLHSRMHCLGHLLISAP
jgi:hypothetical protein